jgi:hypothetical protein
MNKDARAGDFDRACGRFPSFFVAPIRGHRGSSPHYRLRDDVRKTAGCCAGEARKFATSSEGREIVKKLLEVDDSTKKPLIVPADWRSRFERFKPELLNFAHHLYDIDPQFRALANQLSRELVEARKLGPAAVEKIKARIMEELQPALIRHAVSSALQPWFP